jgi:phospholipid/cholesterol/gamma-HCH transport system substrate-binding protein
VTNLRNLEPTVRALADVGPNLAADLAFMPTYPYPQNFIDRAIRGDYLNEFITFDFTIPRLKRGLFLGTRWGQEGAPLVPAPGDPWYANYTKDPLNMPITPAPTAVATMPPLIDPPAPEQADTSPADAAPETDSAAVPAAPTDSATPVPLPPPAASPGPGTVPATPNAGGN